MFLLHHVTDIVRSWDDKFKCICDALRVHFEIVLLLMVEVWKMNELSFSLKLKHEQIILIP